MNSSRVIYLTNADVWRIYNSDLRLDPKEDMERYSLSLMKWIVWE